MSSSHGQIDARRRYRAHLRQSGLPVRRGSTGYTVHWSLELDCDSPESLLQAVLDADTRPERLLKRSALNRSGRARLFGREVVVKRFDLPTSRLRWKYRFRVSRARRAWAAARTLGELDLPTPAPLAIVERVANPWPAESFTVTEFLPGAMPARRWIKAQLHRRPPAFRSAFARDGYALLMSLYLRRIYHGDTKTSNLLVVSPETPAQRQFFWIDLECMAFGVSPSRRRVLRNLIQLNGSVGSKLTESDRLDFLHQFADAFPWVRHPGTADLIRRRTLRRLARELRGLCGP